MKTLTTQFLRRHAHMAFILAFSLFAWAPLLTPAYFFGAHDAPHSVFFLVEFDQTLGDGYLWPRWAPDFAFGYGYPLFNLYAPLAFYAAEILHLIGFGFVGAVKAMYALATMGAGLAMYGFIRRILGAEAGLLGAVVYMLVPFHLVEVFVRSAYPEFVALALLPLVLWAFTNLVAAPTPRRVALAGLSYGILILTHHTTFFTFSPFLIAYLLYLLVGEWRCRGARSLWRAGLPALAAGVLGIALSSIYLIPMLAELRYVKLGQWTAYNYDFRQHFVYFSQLLSPEWGFGYSGPGLEDGMPFQLGAVVLVLVIFGGWLALTGRGQRRAGDATYSHDVPRGPALFFLAATVVIVWLLSPAAQFAWHTLPIASLVQFPWRLLGLAALTMSVAAGSVYPLSAGLARDLSSPSQDDPKTSEVTPPSSLLPAEAPSLPVEVCLLALVLAMGAFGYTLPQYTPVESWRESPEAVIRWDSFSPPDRVAMVVYTDEQPTTSPMEAQYAAGEPLQVATILAGEGTVETLRHGGASDEIRVRAAGPVTVQFYTYDYPGWRVTLDGRHVDHRHDPPYGLITVEVPTGDHQLVLRMGSTPPRLAGTLMSLAAILIIGGGLWGGRIWRWLSRLI